MIELLGGLKILELTEHEGELREGNHHIGMSALMDVVAIKPI